MRKSFIKGHETSDIPPPSSKDQKGFQYILLPHQKRGIDGRSDLRDRWSEKKKTDKLAAEPGRPEFAPVNFNTPLVDSSPSPLSKELPV